MQADAAAVWEKRRAGETRRAEHECAVKEGRCDEPGMGALTCIWVRRWCTDCRARRRTWSAPASKGWTRSRSRLRNGTMQKQTEGQTARAIFFQSPKNDKHHTTAAIAIGDISYRDRLHQSTCHRPRTQYCPRRYNPGCCIAERGEGRRGWRWARLTIRKRSASKQTMGRDIAHWAAALPSRRVIASLPLHGRGESGVGGRAAPFFSAHGARWAEAVATRGGGKAAQRRERSRAHAFSCSFSLQNLSFFFLIAFFSPISPANLAAVALGRRAAAKRAAHGRAALVNESEREKGERRRSQRRIKGGRARAKRSYENSSLGRQSERERSKKKAAAAGGTTRLGMFAGDGEISDSFQFSLRQPRSPPCRKTHFHNGLRAGLAGRRCDQRSHDKQRG